MVEYLENSTQQLSLRKDTSESKSTTSAFPRDIFQIVNFRDIVLPQASKDSTPQSVHIDGAEFTKDGLLIPSLEQTIVVTQQPTSVSNTAMTKIGDKAFRDEATRSTTTGPSSQSTKAGPSTTSPLEDSRDVSLPRTVQQLTSDVEGIKHQMEYGGSGLHKARSQNLFLLCLFCFVLD